MISLSLYLLFTSAGGLCSNVFRLSYSKVIRQCQNSISEAARQGLCLVCTDGLRGVTPGRAGAHRPLCWRQSPPGVCHLTLPQAEPVELRHPEALPPHGAVPPWRDRALLALLCHWVMFSKWCCQGCADRAGLNSLQHSYSQDVRALPCLGVSELLLSACRWLTCAEAVLDVAAQPWPGCWG